jgi:hypothetical protein
MGDDAANANLHLHTASRVLTDSLYLLYKTWKGWLGCYQLATTIAGRCYVLFGPLKIHVRFISRCRETYIEARRLSTWLSTIATLQQCATRLSIYSIQVPEQTLSRAPINLTLPVLREQMPPGQSLLALNTWFVQMITIQAPVAWSVRINVLSDAFSTQRSGNGFWRLAL